jgi:hypothetical protein
MIQFDRPQPGQRVVLECERLRSAAVPSIMMVEQDFVATCARAGPAAAFAGRSQRSYHPAERCGARPEVCRTHSSHCLICADAATAIED